MVANEEESLKTLTQGLTRASYAIREARDGPAAVGALSAHPPPGLVVVDEHRPHVIAPDLLQASRKILEVPVIVISGEPYSSTYSEASSFLRKPFEWPELVRRATDLLPIAAPESIVVVFERDPASGWWVATSKRFPSCSGRGGSIDVARRNFRDALARELGEARASTAQLFEDVRLSPKGGSWRSF